MTRNTEPKNAAEERRQRLADELRANLLRRKAQNRDRRKASGSTAEAEKEAKTDKV
jgi:hypothetical protein